MRSILFLLFFITFFAVSPLLWLIILILRLFSRNLSDRFALWWIKFACRTGKLMAGTRVIVKGLGNIPEDRTVVFVLNHRSIFDIILNVVTSLSLSYIPYVMFVFPTSITSNIFRSFYFLS